MYANAQRQQYQPNYPTYRPGNNPTGYDQGYQYQPQPQYRNNTSYSAGGPGTLIYGDSQTTYGNGNYPNNQPWNQPGYVGTPPFVNDGTYTQGPTSSQGLNDFLSVFRTVAPAVIATMPAWGGHDHGYRGGNYPTGYNQYAYNQPYNYGGYRQGNYPTGYYGGNNGYYGNNSGISIRARIPF